MKLFQKIIILFIMIFLSITIARIGIENDLRQQEENNIALQLQIDKDILNHKIFNITKRIQNIDPKPDFVKLTQSTVEIKVGHFGGAGNIIKQDDKFLYIITAKHIVDCEGQIDIQFVTTQSNKFIRVLNVNRNRVYKDKFVDMAIIKIDRPQGNFAYLQLQTQMPKIGTKIYTIGHPLNLHYTVNEGIVSGYDDKKYGTYRKNYMMISAPAFSGNSGGACINGNNEYVGIVVGIAYTIESKGYIVYLPHLVFVVTIEDIQRFVKELKI